MVNLIVRILISAFSVYVASLILPGVTINSFQTALIVAVVLGAINMFIKPVLILLTLPLTLLTFGLFAFVLNALLILLASNLVPGFTVDGLLWALTFSFVVSIISGFLNTLSNN